MRFRVTDRMLAALSGLLIIALGIVLGAFGAGLLPAVDLSFLQGPFTIWQRVIIVGVALLLFLLGVHGLWMLFRRRADKGFIVQRTDMGDMSIAMAALRNMVMKCVDQHPEVTVKKIRIHRQRNGIIVDLKILLASGINIPLTVNVLQKQIKQYITSCSGVDVHEVRVQVDTGKQSIEGKKEEKPALEQNAVPAALLQDEPTVETAAGSIMRHTEEPADYVEPVVVEAAEEVYASEETAIDEIVGEEVFQAPTDAAEEMTEAYAEAAETVEAVFEEASEPVPETAEEVYAAEEAEFVQESEEAIQGEQLAEAEMAETEFVSAEEVADETQAPAEETAEETTEEPERWAQVGEAFIRQDDEDEE